MHVSMQAFLEMDSLGNVLVCGIFSVVQAKSLKVWCLLRRLPSQPVRGLLRVSQASSDNDTVPAKSGPTLMTLFLYLKGRMTDHPSSGSFLRSTQQQALDEGRARSLERHQVSCGC